MQALINYILPAVPAMLSLGLIKVCKNLYEKSEYYKTGRAPRLPTQLNPPAECMTFIGYIANYFERRRKVAWEQFRQGISWPIPGWLRPPKKNTAVYSGRKLPIHQIMGQPEKYFIRQDARVVTIDIASSMEDLQKIYGHPALPVAIIGLTFSTMLILGVTFLGLWGIVLAAIWLPFAVYCIFGTNGPLETINAMGFYPHCVAVFAPHVVLLEGLDGRLTVPRSSTQLFEAVAVENKGTLVQFRQGAETHRMVLVHDEFGLRITNAEIDGWVRQLNEGLASSFALNNSLDAPISTADKPDSSANVASDLIVPTS